MNMKIIGDFPELSYNIKSFVSEDGILTKMKFQPKFDMIERLGREHTIQYVETNHDYLFDGKSLDRDKTCRMLQFQSENHDIELRIKYLIGETILDRLSQNTTRDLYK